VRRLRRWWGRLRRRPIGASEGAAPPGNPSAPPQALGVWCAAGAGRAGSQAGQAGQGRAGRQAWQAGSEGTTHPACTSG
jgi:hypothetical protein